MSSSGSVSDEAIFDAAWDMVVFAGEFTGSNVEISANFKDLLRFLNQNEVHGALLHERLGYLDRPFGGEREPRFSGFGSIRSSAGGSFVSDLSEENTVFQFGMAPVRVNVLTSIDAVSFEEAWTHRVETHLSGIPISVLSLEDLIRNKEAAGRDSDRIHLSRLRKYGKSES
jgi:hypothetical protein